MDIYIDCKIEVSKHHFFTKDNIFLIYFELNEVFIISFSISSIKSLSLIKFHHFESAPIIFTGKYHFPFINSLIFSIASSLVNPFLKNG